MLKTRLDLIQSGKFESTQLRLRNLKLIRKTENGWVEVKPDDDSALLTQKQKLVSTILTFNVRSLIEMSRRTCLANAICLSNKHDILCLTETWLTDEERSETLFIPEFEIYRCDRPSKITRRNMAVS